MRSTLRRAPAFAVVCAAVLALAGAAGATFNTSRLVSVGTNADAAVAYAGASADGSKVFFTTTDQLVAADTDTRKDIYMRAGGATTLITPGTAAAVAFAGVTADGSTVFFSTTDGLDPSDTDGLKDLYSATGGAYTLVTPGTAAVMTYQAASADGSRVVFSTAESLDPSDTDTLADLYLRSGGTTTLLTPGTAVATTFEGASADLAHVFFSTTESLSASDTDAVRDIYDRTGGAYSLVTPSTSAAVAFTGNSADGTKVFLTTTQKLDAVADTDTLKDEYQVSAGTYTLLTPGTSLSPTDLTAVGNSADGNHVFFTTAEALAGTGDADTAVDVYDRSGGTTTLVTPGTASVVTYDGTTTDGSDVYFNSTESLAAADTDGGLDDVYERAAGATTLVSKPGANASGAPAASTWGGSSTDGSHVFFVTAEKLAGDDVDASLADVYEALTDSTSPQITPTQSPNGSNGWFTSAPATLHLAASDDIGLASLNCALDGSSAALANGSSTQATAAGDVQTSADGDHAVDCQATDGAGNVTTLPTQRLELDTASPSITPSQSPNGPNGFFTSAPATLHVHATDTLAIGSISCTIDGSPATPVNVVTTATALDADVQTGGDGDHSVDCTAYDAAGNATPAATQHLKLDTTPPAVSFAQTPTGSNGWFKTSPATVTVTAADTLAIGALTCTLDGSPATLTNTSSSATSAQGDVRTSAQGDHLVSCTGTDAAGNQKISTAHLKLDSTAPTVTPSQSPNGINGWFKTAPATLHLVAADTQAIGTLTCTLDGSPATLANTVTTATSIAGDVKTSADGDHLVVCTGTDSAGNTTTTATQHLKLDTGSPAVTFAQTPNGTNGWFKTSPAKVRATATDASGISSLTCKLDNASTTLGNVTTTSTSTAGDVQTSAQGDHTVVCTAVDNTGNTTVSTAQHLKLDSVAPALTVANITVNPAGATGTTVSSYSTTTSDATSPPVALACTPAAPHLFASGDTNVSCTATDQAGNATTKTFTVHVRTPVELVAVLRGMVTGASPPLGGTLVPILSAQLDFVTQYLNWKPKPKPVDACSHLTEFTNRIATEMAKPKPAMTKAQATSLTSYANTIRPLIPC